MGPHSYQKSQSAMFVLPEKVSVQLSSEQSVGDVGITQLDWKRRDSEAAKVVSP